MPLNQSMLGEYDQEMANTRKTLERIPEDKFDWAPHPKSMKLGSLAQHLAEMAGWVAETLSKDALDIAPTGEYVQSPRLSSRQALLALFDDNVSQGRELLSQASDDAVMMKPWSLQANGQTLFTLPKAGVLRSFVMNHMIHHRAQLGVYLRLNNIPVPALYGPSADENKF
ncbi:MAG: DinB family protein [Acidobacteriia bacterium]|nr:DinB family protein [Terriglobia bacterium]